MMNIKVSCFEGMKEVMVVSKNIMPQCPNKAVASILKKEVKEFLLHSNTEDSAILVRVQFDNDTGVIRIYEVVRDEQGFHALPRDIMFDGNIHGSLLDEPIVI